MKNSCVSFLLCVLICAPLAYLRPEEEHPRYTAARLMNKFKHVLEGKIEMEKSHIFTEDITVDDCGQSGDYEYLSKKLEALIPNLSQADISVKFAYLVPFINNTIQFSTDEALTLRNRSVVQGEKAFFARVDDEENEYQIFEIRSLTCHQHRNVS